MRKPILVLLLLGLVWGTAVPRTQAQDESFLWSVPRLLSSPGINNTSATEMIADPHGFVHVFWTELNPEDEITTLQYATFDGIAWTQPNDLVATAPNGTIVAFSPALGSDGTLHLVWSGQNLGPVYYTNAPALAARSASAWERPTTLDAPASQLKLRVDGNNILHLMLANIYGTEPGIYYTRSEDAGDTWLTTRWLDPDIPPSATPSALNFQIDHKNGLHTTWFYVATGLGSTYGTWIRYVHSLDGGENWATPVTIDEADESEDELQLPEPGLVLAGDAVHVVYAGNSGTQRESRYSLDRGVTWSGTKRILGDLQGQAIGDGLSVDSLGRVHFLGQIRWPQAIYHAYLNPAQPEAGWSAPQIAYLIAESDAAGRQGRYHAHRLRSSVVNGNILVVTFSDEANGPLYVMWRTLDDAPSIDPLPLPTPTPMPEVTATPLPGVALTPTPPPFAGTDLATPEDPTNVGWGVWLGVLPALLLVGGVLGFRFYRMRQA
ncbi:MAG: sialidase family protein [Candidatus Promineifilaceae bacterium]|nr:exo-alpha-sialidase [Anaerolineaceae bacterium]